jgi:hypothetical protein
LVVRLALATYTGIDFFMNLSLNELYDVAEDVEEGLKAVNGSGK